MSDKGMANCFCGSPIILEEDGRDCIVKHLHTPYSEAAYYVGSNIEGKMTRWLEEIHGLSGTGTEDLRAAEVRPDVLD